MSKKRLLSVLLVLAMCLGMLPTWAMADGPSYSVYGPGDAGNPFTVTIAEGVVDAESSNVSVTTKLEKYIVAADPSEKLLTWAETPEAQTVIESSTGLGEEGTDWMKLPEDRALTGYDQLKYLLVVEYVQQNDGTYKNGNFYLQRLTSNLKAKALKELPIQQDSANVELTGVSKTDATHVTLTLTPKEGGVWNVANKDTAGTLTFTLPTTMFSGTLYLASTIDVAIPAATYTVTTRITIDGEEDEASGIATLSVSADTGAKDAEITVTKMIINDLYAVDEEATSAEVLSGTLTLTGDTTLTLALKSPKEVSLAANDAQVTMTVGGQAAPQSAKVGSQITVVLTPTEGAVINTVTATGIELGDPVVNDGVYTYSVTVGDDPIVITATTIAAQTITLTVRDENSVAVDAANYTVTGIENGDKVQAGTTVAFTVAASNNWVVKSVTFNTSELTATEDGYSFTMPGATAAVVVTLTAPTAMTLNFKDVNGDALTESDYVTGTLYYWGEGETADNAEDETIDAATTVTIPALKAGEYNFRIVDGEEAVLAEGTFTLEAGEDGESDVNLAITPTADEPEVDSPEVTPGETASIGTAEVVAEKDVEASITITADAVTALGGASGVEIKLTNATVTLSSDAFGGMNADGNVTITVETESLGADAQGVYANAAEGLSDAAKAITAQIGTTLMVTKSIDINVADSISGPIEIDGNGEAIGTFTFKATAPENAIAGTTPQVYFVDYDDEGRITTMEAVDTTVAGDQITFEPKHFSEYILVYEVECETGDPYIVTVTVSDAQEDYTIYTMTVNGAVGDEYLVLARTQGTAYVFNPIKLSDISDGKTMQVYVPTDGQVDLYIVEDAAGIAEADGEHIAAWVGIEKNDSGEKQ